MLSETLAAEFERYRLGDKIRALRKAKKLGLVQLGEHTGLSPGLLSKIERGQIVPTLPTLLRIALVFGVGLEHFFVEAVTRPAITVVRRAERLRFPDRPREDRPSYFFESLNFPARDRRMNAYLAEFPAGADASPPHSHPGAELVYVIAGGLEISVVDDVSALDEGDAAYFDSGRPHGYRAIDARGCTAVVAVVPAAEASADRRNIA
jgi:transcriptional regulator with XRE-family HTH domain